MLTDCSPVPGPENYPLRPSALPDDFQINTPVEVVFDDVTPEWTLIKFRPVRET
jgi:hypothetical protein